MSFCPYYRKVFEYMSGLIIVCKMIKIEAYVCGVNIYATRVTALGSGNTKKVIVATAITATTATFQFILQTECERGSVRIRRFIYG